MNLELAFVERIVLSPGAKMFDVGLYISKDGSVKEMIGVVFN